MLTLEETQHDATRKKFNGKTCEIDGVNFTYSAFENRLENSTNDIGCIACPVCYNKEFKISYGFYNAKGNCHCGCVVEIYSE